jgi:acetyl/propionyl-CoA carboxylase alpha subunit
VLAGERFVLDLSALGAGSFALRQDGRSRVFHCVRDGDVVHLFWDGAPYELRVLKDGAPRAHRPAAGSLEAPMPGKVIKVSVSVGQQVNKGDEILVVEAMKMENQVRAPKAGRVVKLAATVGEMVGPGAVLAEIE